MTNPAAVPTAVVDIHGDGRWMSMHNRFIAEAKEKEPEVLIVGDSIIQLLAQNEIWDKLFVPLHSLNFGIGGDETQNVLWRLQNGELEDFEPKVIVVGVGTNNHRHTVSQVVDGILECVRTCHVKQPQAHVIIMGIPPRGQFVNPLREKIALINQSVSESVVDMACTMYHHVDPGLFVHAVDGSISHHDMYDYLHLTRQGYHKLAEPLLDDIQTLLKNFLTADTLSAHDTDTLSAHETDTVSPRD